MFYEHPFYRAQNNSAQNNSAQNNSAQNNRAQNIPIYARACACALTSHIHLIKNPSRRNVRGGIYFAYGWSIILDKIFRGPENVHFNLTSTSIRSFLKCHSLLDSALSIGIGMTCVFPETPLGFAYSFHALLSIYATSKSIGES